MSQERLFYYFKQLALAGLLFVVTIGLIEGVLRVKSYLGSGENFRITQPNGLITLKPNIDQVARSTNGLPIHFKTNAEGFASENHTLVAATGTKRIVFLGNSFTQGTDVDYEKKMTSLVQKYYGQSGSGHTIEVMNFAIGGYSIAEQLILYNEYVKKYHPDLVLLVSYVGYDFATNVRFLPQKDAILHGDTKTLTAQLINEATDNFTQSQQNFKLALVTHSEVVRYVIRLIREHEKLYALAIRLGFLHQPFTQEAANYFTDVWAYMNPASAPHREVMEFTADTIERLRTLVKQDGARFGFVLIPSYWQVDATYVEQLKDKHIPLDLFLPNTIVKKRAAGAFPILDLSEPIAHALNDERIPVFINDVGHFTQQGNEVAAKEIVAFLRYNEREFGL